MEAWGGIGRQKMPIWTAQQLGLEQSAGLKCLMDRPSVACGQAERAWIVAESLLPGAQVAEVARKHGATRSQIYDWRRRFRQRGELPSREAPQPPFTPMVVEGALEERHAPAVKLEIAIGDAVRTDGR